ncbi:hypothetical protein HK100_004147 [Physocladia obscura]|uniref:Uncharacterized protein n=1 Tax=Physocladia obscura TaxID=109957 RepID=A0AAD5T6D9_9FUNG|nr:hypothetical protein HK100_004147 [Physocladia obscura]
MSEIPENIKDAYNLGKPDTETTSGDAIFVKRLAQENSELKTALMEAQRQIEMLKLNNNSSQSESTVPSFSPLYFDTVRSLDRRSTNSKNEKEGGVSIVPSYSTLPRKLIIAPDDDFNPTRRNSEITASRKKKPLRACDILAKHRHSENAGSIESTISAGTQSYLLESVPSDESLNSNPSLRDVGAIASAEEFFTHRIYESPKPVAEYGDLNFDGAQQPRPLSKQRMTASVLNSQTSLVSSPRNSCSSSSGGSEHSSNNSFQQNSSSGDLTQVLNRKLSVKANEIVRENIIGNALEIFAKPENTSIAEQQLIQNNGFSDLSKIETSQSQSFSSLTSGINSARSLNDGILSDLKKEFIEGPPKLEKRLPKKGILKSNHSLSSKFSPSIESMETPLQSVSRKSSKQFKWFPSIISDIKVFRKESAIK